jgi:hypothetical protein
LSGLEQALKSQGWPYDAGFVCKGNDLLIRRFHSVIERRRNKTALHAIFARKTNAADHGSHDCVTQNTAFPGQAMYYFYCIGFAAMMITAPTLAATPYWVRIVDAETGRGVPLVELRTPNAVAFWTDSNGVAVIDDPAFQDHDVAFVIHSDGYEFPGKLMIGEDSGRILQVRPGFHDELKIRRLNIAERLYRITGADIYRDSVLAGLKAPIAQPILDGGVVGQDTNVAIPYQGKIFWCWGDTVGLAGWNFAVSGATSEPPGHGGLDPSVGVNLTYFIDSTGFNREMLPLIRPGPPELVWIEGLFTVPDEQGRERLLATYTRQAGLAPPSERGVAVFDDVSKQFRVLAQMPLMGGHISSHPFHVSVNGKDYWYLMPHQRVPNHWNAITNPASYESYTCLESGARFDKAKPRLDRRPTGELVCGWKRNTDWIGSDEERELIARGLMKKEEALFPLLDVDSGAETRASPSSIAWNAYRKKWIMLAEKTGTVYYSEADDPIGPWLWAKKILSHQ